MKLEEIGFYTLSDKRAKDVSWTSDMQRCELILTDRCNFKCPYCRGIQAADCKKCHLVKDDMVSLNMKHFPCVIYMREMGDPVGDMEGKTLEEIREARREWFMKVDTSKDPICSRNCLDVCIDHNNRVEELLKI